MKYKRILRNYWEKYYLNKNVNLCGLCGNTGIIDTSQTAISPSGIKSGGTFYCICPNGRQLNSKDK